MQLNLMPIQVQAASQVKGASPVARPVMRRPLPVLSPSSAAPAFSTALKAMRQKRPALPDAAYAPAEKLDKPAAKKTHHPSQESTDKPSDGSPEAAPAVDATVSETDDRSESKPVAHDTPEATPSTDGTGATLAQVTLPVAPEIAVQASARSDAAAPPAGSEKPVVDAALPTAEMSGPVIRPDAPPGQTAPEPQAAQGAANASTDQESSAEPHPGSALKDARSHEKNSRAAHVSVETASSSGSESAAEQAATPATTADTVAAAVASSATGTSGVSPAALPDKAINPPSPDSFLGTTADSLKAHPADSPHAEAAPAAQDSHAAEAPNPFDQVVLGLKGKLDARNGTAEIQLNPPNLGSVHVSVTLENGTLTAEFQSASNMVRDLLKDNMDKLKTTLQSQGVAVDRLAVDAPPASPDAGSAGQNPQASFGSATHDGRSAGQYQQDGRPGPSRSGGEGFARTLSQVQDAPLDLVA